MRHTAQNVATELASLPAGTRYMVAFPWPASASANPAGLAARIVEEGFVRAIIDDRVVDLSTISASAGSEIAEPPTPLLAQEVPADDAAC